MAFQKLFFKPTIEMENFFCGMLGEVDSNDFSIRQPKIFASENIFKKKFLPTNFSALLA